MLDGDGRVLTGGAAAEVLAADHDVTGLDAGDKRLVDVLHAVAGQLGLALGVQVAGRMMTSVSMLSPYLKTGPFAFIAQTSLGSVMQPVSALAAAVAGLAR